MSEIQYADDDVASIPRLLRLRIPSLMIGLVLGILLSFVTSRFEELLAHNIRVAFFIPFIVYMAAAVGSQTQSIYVRDLKSGHASFKKYFIKETAIGIFLAFASSAVVAVLIKIWFKSNELMFAVSAGMFGAVIIAPLVALLVTEVLQLEHTDPAASAGPIATVIQDTLSILIYGIIASAIIL